MSSRPTPQPHTAGMTLPPMPQGDAHEQSVTRQHPPAARPSVQQMTPLALGIEVRSLLAPDAVQFNYLRSVEDILPQPFGAQLEDIILVNDQEQEMAPAVLCAVDDHSIVVEALKPLAGCRRGARLVVLLPISPQRLDALRTTIHEIQSPTRLKLLCQDRRREVRRRLQLVALVQMRLVPINITTALVQQQVCLVRHIQSPGKTGQDIEYSSITEGLYHSDCIEPAACMQDVESSTPLSCRIQDISPGGMAVTLPEGPQADIAMNRLSLVQVALPYVACGMTRVHFTLQLFGLIRGISDHGAPRRLHLRFLHRLPAEMAVVFAHLERRYLQRQSPLE